MLFYIGAIIGVFSQINAGDDESREHAVNFLKQNVLEMIPKVFDPIPDAAEALSDEIHKVGCLRYLNGDTMGGGGGGGGATLDGI